MVLCSLRGYTCSEKNKADGSQSFGHRRHEDAMDIMSREPIDGALDPEQSNGYRK